MFFIKCNSKNYANNILFCLLLFKNGAKLHKIYYYAKQSTEKSVLFLCFVKWM